MEVYACGIHGFHETIGLDVDEFRVHWKLRFTDEHADQAAYQLVVSTDQAVSLTHQDAICFDTGRVESHEQRNILCHPEPGFKSTTLYYWTVHVWDQHGDEAVSPVQEFYTSYPRSSKLLPPYSMNQTYMPHSSLIFRAWFEDEPNRWKAIWIGDGGDKPIYLRKQLAITRKPSRVIIFASGLGHFNLSINGQPASPHVLDPGWTDYHKTVQFVGYDVTNKLRMDADNGENVIGAHLGNGFYAGDQGDRFFWPKYEDNTYVRYGNELCFFAEVHIHYEDGTHDCITSDCTWKVHKSATTLANIYASEDHDRGQYPVGWDSPSFDDADWITAKPLTGPRGKLRYQSQPPIILHEEMKPVSQRVVSPSINVYDFGQNASIMVQIEASGPAASQYRVRYSETLGHDGKILMPDPLFKTFETDVYSNVILAGDQEREVWTPDFCFTSARYIQIERVTLSSQEEPNGDIATKSLPVIHSVTARHISSAASQLGFVKTDKDDVNALINACHWTFSSNLFSYHTDCPQIEQFGWLEVTSLLFPATQYVRDIESLHTKILQDIVDTQESSGLVPTMAPLMRYMCGPMHDTITWGGAICLLPELIKRYYGSTVVFAKVYDSCVGYLRYIQARERRGGGIIEHGLGDWGRDIAYGNHQANIETAIYYKCLRNVAMMARELGKFDDEKTFTGRAEDVYAAYNKHLLVTDGKTHPYSFYTSLDDPEGARDRTMVAQAMALQCDLVPAEHRADVLQAFIADAEESGHIMRAGEIGLKYLWDTLADADRPDIVLAMARQEEHPSYMRFLRRGETTLSEFWQDACRSKCHDMLGTIYEWFYRYALGVRPLTDAYRTWSLKPCFAGEFDCVKGSVECPYGTISVVFDRKGRGKERSARVEVTVPTGTKCLLSLPHQTSRVSIHRNSTEEEDRSCQGHEVELRQGEYVLDILP